MRSSIRRKIHPHRNAVATITSPPAMGPVIREVATAAQRRFGRHVSTRSSLDSTASSRLSTRGTSIGAFGRHVSTRSSLEETWSSLEETWSSYEETWSSYEETWSSYEETVGLYVSTGSSLVSTESSGR
jgi:hypothetical protein